VKSAQVFACGARLWRALADQAAQTAIGIEDQDVIHAISTRCEQTDEPFDHAGVAEPTASLANVYMAFDRCFDPQGRDRLENKREPGAGSHV
jgi:hypothetical protein